MMLCALIYGRYVGIHLNILLFCRYVGGRFPNPLVKFGRVCEFELGTRIHYESRQKKTSHSHPQDLTEGTLKKLQEVRYIFQVLFARLSDRDSFSWLKHRQVENQVLD